MRKCKRTGGQSHFAVFKTELLYCAIRKAVFLTVQGRVKIEGTRQYYFKTIGYCSSENKS